MMKSAGQLAASLEGVPTTEQSTPVVSNQDSPIDGSVFHALLCQAAAEYDKCLHEVWKFQKASAKLPGFTLADLTEEDVDDCQVKPNTVIPGEVPVSPRECKKTGSANDEPIYTSTGSRNGGEVKYCRANSKHSSDTASLISKKSDSHLELQLDPRWKPESVSSYRSQAPSWKMAGTLSLRSNTTIIQPMEPDLVANAYNGRLRPFVSMPTSPRRVAWDIVGAFLILFDSIAIPLKVFDPPDNWFSISMDNIALVYWTVNMPASLFVGYLEEGRYELNPVKILRHYLKGWFWIDIFVVFPDWCFTIAHWVGDGSDSNAGSSVRLLRILRLVRCMRLLRLAKLKWLMQSIKDHIDNESVDILFNIVKMILCLVVVNHFIACVWFATTLVGAEPRKTWVTVHDFDDSEWTYQYVTSFHWAMTQFTPSSMHVQPQNTFERTFAIIVVIFGLVGFSYLVGSITGSLTELRRMNEDAIKEFWNLRRYLKKKEVHASLRIRIEKYCEHAWSVHKEEAGGSDLRIMSFLTEQLKNELNHAIMMPHLEIHPLFVYLSASSSFAMQRIATKALNTRKMARNETYFEPGELAQKMSFVVSGKLAYTRNDSREMVDKGEDWITEQVLWAREWVTVGDLTAYDVSELLEVSKQVFAETVHRTPQAFERIAAYAQRFLHWIHETPANDWTDVCQGEKVGKEIEAMLESAETLVSISHIEQARLLDRRRSEETIVSPP